MVASNLVTIMAWDRNPVVTPNSKVIMYRVEYYRDDIYSLQEYVAFIKSYLSKATIEETVFCPESKRTTHLCIINNGLIKFNIDRTEERFYVSYTVGVRG